MSGSTEHLFFSHEAFPTHPPMTFARAIPADQSISIARDALQNLPSSTAPSVHADYTMESSSNNSSNQDHRDGDPTTRTASPLTDPDETYTPDLPLVSSPISKRSGPKAPRYLPQKDLPSNIQTLIEDWKTHRLSHITDAKTRKEELLYIPPSTTRIAEFYGLDMTQRGKPCLWLHVQSRRTVTPAEYDWQHERQVLVVTSANGAIPPSLVASQRVAAPHKSQVGGGVAFYIWRGVEGFEPRPSIMKYYGDKKDKDDFLDRAYRLIAEDVIDPSFRRSKRDRSTAGWRVDPDGDFSPKVARTGSRRARHSDFQGSRTPASVARRPASSPDRRQSTVSSKLMSFKLNSDYLRSIDSGDVPPRGPNPDSFDIQSSDPESRDVSRASRLEDEALPVNGQFSHRRKTPGTANGSRPGPCDGCVKHRRECDRQRRCAGCRRLRKKCTYSAPTTYAADEARPAGIREDANRVEDGHSDTEDTDAEDSSDADESQYQNSNAEDSDALQYPSPEADGTDPRDDDPIACYESMMEGCFAEHKALRASHRGLKRKYARCKRERWELAKKVEGLRKEVRELKKEVAEPRKEVMELRKGMTELEKELTERREEMAELEKVHSACAGTETGLRKELVVLRVIHSAETQDHVDEVNKMKGEIAALKASHSEAAQGYAGVMNRMREANEKTVAEKDGVIEKLRASDERNEAKLRSATQVHAGELTRAREAYEKIVVEKDGEIGELTAWREEIEVKIRSILPRS